MHTDGLRKQHQEIRALLTELQALLVNRESAVSESLQIRKLLTQLYGKVQIHLSMEDNILYPKMIKGFDPELSQMAQDFQAEMGAIKKAFSAYIQLWTTDHIQAYAQEFISQSAEIFLRLNRRIDAENDQLFQRYERFYSGERKTTGFSPWI